MIDFSRTFCDLHPNELITNFCCKCTGFITKNNAILASALHAFAHTLKVTSKDEVPQSMKTFVLLIVKCKKAFVLESLLSNNKNPVL
jgi:hypothetical protein